VYISEVFPTNVRAKGQSLGSFTHWAVNAAMSWAFPVIAAKSKGGPFIFFSAMMVVQLITVAFIYPETKGATLEEMSGRMNVHV
jgi:hypothetical protein